MLLWMWVWLVVLGYAVMGMLTWYAARFFMRSDRAELGVIFLSFWPATWIVGLVIVTRNYVRARNYHPIRWLDMRIQHHFAQLVHRDEYGELYSMLSPHGLDFELFVKVKDSTGTHWLAVPPNLDPRTAKAAVAWTYRCDPKDFHPTRV